MSTFHVVPVATVLSTSEEERNQSKENGRRLAAEGFELSEVSLEIDHNVCELYRVLFYPEMCT